MKYLGLFEEFHYNSPVKKMERKSDYATIYLETGQPIKKEDGFIDNEYSFAPDFWTAKLKYILVSFYFHDWTSEESFDEFDKFLDDNKLETIDTKIINYSEFKKGIEIIIKLPEYKIREYSKLYKLQRDAEKYNL